jgi:FixJ family two-component response regulator
MQAVYLDTEIFSLPRPLLNRTPPHSFQTPSDDSASEVVYLVEPDFHAREDISAFLAALDMRVIAFASGAEYLDYTARDTAACVVLNLRLPEISGLELQRRLAQKSNPPVIFISDHCDVASTVCAMKAGAIEFLTKPFDLSTLIAPIQAAFAQDRKLRQRKAELAKLQERFGLLTPREREVLPLIVGGLLNKQAASILGISEVTLQIHRSQVMRKMQAGSFAELVRMAVKLRIRYWHEGQPQPARRAGMERAFRAAAQ